MKLKYALVSGNRQEAKPGLRGECPVCVSEVIAHCGEIKIWHWAHARGAECDHWWENETDWHRRWKNQFPDEWQEIVQIADDGEKHIADVKTDQGWVIEFQHSFLKPEERKSRNEFYGDVVWVVDGLRRKTDIQQFIKAASDAQTVSQQPLVLGLRPDACRLVREWSTSPVPVFFDFGGSVEPQGLWLLVPLGVSHTSYLVLVGYDEFVGSHRKSNFDLQPLIDEFAAYEQRRLRAMKAQFAMSRAPNSFQRHMARKNLRRRRF